MAAGLARQAGRVVEIFYFQQEKYFNCNPSLPLLWIDPFLGKCRWNYYQFCHILSVNPFAFDNHVCSENVGNISGKISKFPDIFWTWWGGWCRVMRWRPYIIHCTTPPILYNSRPFLLLRWLTKCSFYSPAWREREEMFWQYSGNETSCRWLHCSSALPHCSIHNSLSCKVIHLKQYLDSTLPPPPPALPLHHVIYTVIHPPHPRYQACAPSVNLIVFNWCNVANLAAEYNNWAR